MRIDPFEVADVLEVPLAFVMNPSNHRRDSLEREGRTRTFYVLPFEDRYIWGATAGMLVNLYEVLRDCFESSSRSPSRCCCRRSPMSCGRDTPSGIRSRNFCEVT